MSARDDIIQSGRVLAEYFVGIGMFISVIFIAKLFVDFTFGM